MMIVRLSEKNFEELKTHLLYDRKHSASKHNIQVLTSRYRILFKWFGNKEFNRENFNEFIKYLREKGHSNDTCNNYIKLAKHVDRFYKINQMQDYSYFDKTTPPPDVLKPEQIEDMANIIINYARNSDELNKRQKALIYTLFLTGARINEILSLTWNDMRKEPTYLLVINQTKIHEVRYAAIPKSLYDLILSLPKYSNYIFSNREGRPIDAETTSLDLKRRAKVCGIDKRVYNHIIRHSFVNFMLRAGTPLHIVSRMVGHKRIETTNTYYIHTMLEELSDMLHQHHPHLKKAQTLETIAKKGKHMLQSFIDSERFGVRLKKHKSHVKFEVHEQ